MTDRRIGVLRRFAGCFLDGRDPERIQHSIPEISRSVCMGWRWAMKT